MPRKQTVDSSSSPKQLRQKTLFGYVQSSSSPARPPASQSPFKKTQTPRSRKRRVKSPSPQNDESGDDGNDTDSDVCAIRFESKVIDLTDQDGEDEDDGGSPRRPTTTSRVKRKARASSSDSDVRIVSSGVVVVGDKGKGRLKKRSDSSGSEDQLVTTKKRRLVQGFRPQKEEDEEEDDDDLMDEVDEGCIVDSRLRRRDKRSAFQKSLEKLKRKKRGQAVAESSSSSEDDTVSDETNEIDFDFITPFEGAKPDSGDESKHDEETVDDSFIVEDEGAETIELPMEYSLSTHQDLTHHFKIICQLFVHLAVQPARKRQAFMKKAASSDNEYFHTPLVVARRKVSGLRDQLVASSTWRPGFKRSLETYPEFELVRMEMALPMCDACHMGGRVSTLIGRVGGLPYDRITFEALDDSDSDDESDEESEEKLEKEFHLGRFCARRTRVFHQFSHWEHMLYTVLSLEVEELRQSDTTGFVKVAFAGGNRPPEDHDDADGIMDWLDQRGIIDMEWQRLRKMMDSARTLDAASARGEDDED